LNASKRELLADCALPVSVLIMSFFGSYVFRDVKRTCVCDCHMYLLTYLRYATVSSRLTQRFTGVRKSRSHVASKFPKVSEIFRVQMSHLRQIASFAPAFCKFLNKLKYPDLYPRKKGGHCCLFFVCLRPYVMVVSFVCQRWSCFRSMLRMDSSYRTQ